MDILIRCSSVLMWAVLSILCIIDVLQSQENIPRTALFSSEESFTCNLTTDQLATWRHKTNDVNLFGLQQVSREVVKLDDAKADTAYDDYSAELIASTQFILSITSVDISDTGVLVCEDTITRNELILYSVAVEAKVSSVTVACQSPCQIESGTITVLDMTDCECTCNATAGYPRDLKLNWNAGDPGDQSQTSSLNGPNGTYDFVRNVTFTATRISTSLECRVDGYTIDDIKNSEDIKKQLPINILYPPECEVKVYTTKVAAKCTVMVTCHCDANPEVSSNGYSYLKNGSPIGGMTNTTEDVVDLDSTVTFSCRANNTVGSGHYVEGEPYTCSTTTTPKVTLMTTSPPESDNLGLIIGVVIAAVVVGGGAIGFSVYWFGIRTSDQESVKRSNNDNTDGNGVNSKLQSEPDQVEYAAVNKPKSDPQPAPRSSKPPGNNTEPEKMELQYADIDHSNRGRSNEIHQPADAPTEYATVQSVIV